MPKFTPRNDDYYSFEDDFDDFDDLGDIRDEEAEFAHSLPQPYAEKEEPEEWERYLNRMTPSGSSAGKGKSAKATAEDDAPPKKKSKVGVVVLLSVLLLAVGAALYVYFCTDLYYVADIQTRQLDVALFVGESSTVEYDLVSFGSGEPELEWSSSEPGVAGVDEQGGITALSAGRTMVTVTDPVSEKSAQCVVTVHNVDEMIISAELMTLGAGESAALTVQTGGGPGGQPEFASADSGVAQVDAFGQITAVATGETDITVSARGFHDVSCHVVVKEAPTFMETPISGEMCKGESRQLTVAIGEGEYASSYSFVSDDPSVVTVDEKGVMTAVGEGSAGVTASAYNGVSVTLPVIVCRETGSVTVPKELTVYNGQPFTMDIADDTGCCQQFYYTSSDPDVLRVDEGGVMYALKQGSATVTCTAYNGKSAKCEVTARIVDHTRPFTSQRVYDNVTALAATYPEFISVESIGKSFQGRDLTMLKMGTGPRKVLIVSGMHSRESIAVTFTMRCIDEYAQAAASGTRYGKYNVKKMLEEYTMYIVPLMNPDGMDIFMGLDNPEFLDRPLTAEELDEFKNTANGVNLNRNFPFEWGAEGVKLSGPDHRSYAGDSAGSEPETQAIIQLCAQHEFEWMLDMHCKGHMIYFQDKVNVLDERSKELAHRLYNRCEFTLTDASSPFEMSGGMENWFRSAYGKPGICVELVGNQYNTDVNEYFELKVDWKRTKNVFLMCMED